MIYIDKYPVDRNYDGGDSAVRVGIMNMSVDNATWSPIALILDFFTDKGMVRHPKQFPWNNPKNFTRDQTLCLVAGAYRQSFSHIIGNRIYRDLLKTALFDHIKRCFFTQSIERDKIGSTKMLYPHDFYKDSNPISTTYRRRFNIETMSFERTILNRFDMDGNDWPIESRIVDYRDFMFPNHMWMLIKAARYYPLYVFGLIGIPFFILMLLLHSFGKPNEENQMIAECYVNGKWALRLYRFLHRRWKTISFKYWNERDEVEYHHYLEQLVDNA